MEIMNILEITIQIIYKNKTMELFKMELGEWQSKYVNGYGIIFGSILYF